MTKVWVLESLYKGKKNDDPRNWATALFLSEERAKEFKKHIEEERTDIEECFLWKGFIDDEINKDNTFGKCKFCGGAVRVVEPTKVEDRIIFCDGCKAVFSLSFKSSAKDLVDAYMREPK